MQWAGLKCRTGGSPEWCQGCQGHKTGWGVPCTTACALQQAHRDSVLVLEHKTKVEEGQDHQAFMEAFRVAVRSCPPRTHGHSVPPTAPDQWCALSHHPRDVSHSQATGSGRQGLVQTVADRGSVQTPPTPSVSRTPMPQVGAKFWCHSSDQDVPALGQDEEEVAEIDIIPKECPCKKWKDGRPAGKALKEAQEEAFSKQLDVVKVARWAYLKAHRTIFKQERLYDLSSMFWQMANSTNLMGTKTHEVQEAWTSQKELRATNQAARASPKDIYCL